MINVIRRQDMYPEFIKIQIERVSEIKTTCGGIVSIMVKIFFGILFTMNLTTIEAFTHKNNEASKALLKKHKFIFQNERREKGFDHNRIFQLKK